MIEDSNEDPIKDGEEVVKKGNIKSIFYFLIGFVIILLVALMIVMNELQEQLETTKSINDYNYYENVDEVEEIIEQEEKPEEVIEDNIQEEPIENNEPEPMRIYTFEEFDNETNPDFYSVIRLNGIDYDSYLMYVLDIPRKTFISLHEKLKLNAVFGESDWYEYHNKYCTTPSLYGDSAGYFWIESNYEQYGYKYFNNNYIEKVKYSEPITFKATVTHELTCNLENYDFDKDYSMEEYTKFQYDYARDLIHYSFDGYKGTDGYYRVNGMSILNGNDENWEDYGRAKKIKVTVEGKEYIFELEDSKEIQLFDIGYTQNTIEKPIEIKVEVLEAYPGLISNDVYIYDIRFGFDTSIMLGRQKNLKTL